MNFAQMMKQAQTLKKDMDKAQEALATLEVSGTAGSGAVTVVLSGKGVLKSIRLDPQLTCDDVLEDLILVAHQQAWNKLEETKSQMLGPLNALF